MLNVYVGTAIALWVFFTIAFFVAQAKENNGLQDVAWGQDLLWRRCLVIFIQVQSLSMAW